MKGIKHGKRKKCQDWQNKYEEWPQNIIVLVGNIHRFGQKYSPFWPEIFTFGSEIFQGVGKYSQVRHKNVQGDVKNYQEALKSCVLGWQNAHRRHSLTNLVAPLAPPLAPSLVPHPPLASSSWSPQLLPSSEAPPRCTFFLGAIPLALKLPGTLILSPLTTEIVLLTHSCVCRVL